MNTQDEIKKQKLRALNEAEFKKISDPSVINEFQQKISKVGYHINFLVTDEKNEVQELN